MKPQTNENAERYKRMKAAIMSHYMAEHQGDWDSFIQPLTYAYTTPVSCSTGSTPLSSVLSRHLHVSTNIDLPSALQADANNETTTAVL